MAKNAIASSADETTSCRVANDCDNRVVDVGHESADSGNENIVDNGHEIVDNRNESNDG